MGKLKQKTECSGLEWGDFLLLLDKLKKEKEYRFLLFSAIGTYCGLRANDILDKNEIQILEKKTTKTRNITINQNLFDIIKYCEEKLYPTIGKEIYWDNFIICNREQKKLSLQYVNRKLHYLFDLSKLKVQNSSSHTFRKTFGKRIYEMNGRSSDSLVLLSQIFGHSSIEITRKYIGLRREQIQNVYISL